MPTPRNENEADQQVWSLGPHADFTVRSMYNLLQPVGEIADSSTNIWISKLPSKASFLLWLVIKEKVLTNDNLMKRSFVMASC